MKDKNNSKHSNSEYDVRRRDVIKGAATAGLIAAAFNSRSSDDYSEAVQVLRCSS